MRTFPPCTRAVLLCVTLLVATCPSSGLAGVRPRLEAGLNLSSLCYDEPLTDVPVWDPGWRTSFTGGAALEFPLRHRLALVTGLRYVQQGNRVEYDTGAGSVRWVGEFRVVQNYLSLPVLLECRPLPSQRVFFSFGPEVALLLSGRLIFEETRFIDGVSNEQTAYDDIKSSLESTNLSLDVGVGFEIPMASQAAVLGLRYSHGLTDVPKEEDWYVNWKTRSVEFLAGIRW